MRQLWIFRVSGGEPFQIKVKGNPVMRHDGGSESILRTLCTDEQAAELEREMVTHGAQVRAHNPRETEEDKFERRNLLSFIGGDRNFPSPRCPECAWFDPHLVSLCGAGVAPGGEGWEDEAVTIAMDHPKFKEDFGQCPLREGFQ